jgi:hypothetical protein
MRTRLFIRRHVDVLAIGVLLLTFGVVQTGRDVFLRKHEIVERLRVERTKALEQLHRSRRIRPVQCPSTVASSMGIV